MAARRAAVTLLVASAAIAGPAVAQTADADPPGLEFYGEADYAWSLRTLDGDRVSLEELRGEVLFINLWATWCTPCVVEMRSIERLRDSLGDVDVRFLVVTHEDARPVERFLRARSYDLPIYLEVSPMPEAYGLEVLPTTYVVDRRGRIVLKHRGAARWDDDSVRGFLAHLAAGDRGPKPGR